MKEPTLSDFAAFCESKPAKEAYRYLSTTNCACAQFAAHIGVEYDTAMAIPKGTFWQQAEWHAVSVAPSTFGALAARLREVPQ